MLFYEFLGVLKLVEEYDGKLKKSKNSISFAIIKSFRWKNYMGREIN
jgi:hypothetical protein